MLLSDALHALLEEGPRLIPPDEVWEMLLDELRPDMGSLSSAIGQVRHGKVSALCRVLSLDQDNVVGFREPDKILLEARKRLGEEARRR